MKQYDKAIQDYDEALRIDPKDAYALCGKSYLLAASPNGSQRDGKKALDLAKQAHELEKESGWGMRTLSVAYAELGDFEAAVKWQTQAIELDSNEKSKADCRTRLQFYQEKKPFHFASPQY